MISSGKCPFLLAIILVLTFFVTSADSATYVLAMLSEDGNLNPSNRKKVIWGVMLALIAIALMFSGGLTALQNTLIIVAFPFSIVLVLMMWSLMKELYHEKSKWDSPLHQTDILRRINRLNLMRKIRRMAWS